MRARCVLSVLLVGAAISSLAYGGDEEGKDAQPKVEEISYDAWCARVHEIRASDRTTLQKLDALQRAAAFSVVLDESKLVDVFPHRSGDGATADLCSTFGRRWRRIELSGHEAEAARAWKKWDRIRVIVDVTIRSVDGIDEAARLYPSAEKCRRPGPGIEYPEVAKHRGSYARWRSAYIRDVRRGRWESAWKKIQAARDKVWTFDAVVERVRHTARPYHCDIDILIGDDYRKTINVIDPQVGEAIQPGDVVELGLLLCEPFSATPQELKSRGGDHAIGWIFLRNQGDDD